MIINVLNKQYDKTGYYNPKILKYYSDEELFNELETLLQFIELDYLCFHEGDMHLVTTEDILLILDAYADRERYSDEKEN